MVDYDISERERTFGTLLSRAEELPDEELVLNGRQHVLVELCQTQVVCILLSAELLRSECK